MTPVALMEQCAPAIAPVTLAAVVQQESGGNPLALHDNTAGKSYRPASLTEAAQIARKAHLDRLSLRQAALALGLLTGEQFDALVRHEAMVRP